MRQPVDPSKVKVNYVIRVPGRDARLRDFVVREIWQLVGAYVFVLDGGYTWPIAYNMGVEIVRTRPERGIVYPVLVSEDSRPIGETFGYTERASCDTRNRR